MGTCAVTLESCRSVAVHDRVEPSRINRRPAPLGSQVREPDREDVGEQPGVAAVRVEVRVEDGDLCADGGGPNRSAAEPMGVAARNPSNQAQPRPTPTCAGDSPTTVVKKSADVT